MTATTPAAAPAADGSPLWDLAWERALLARTAVEVGVPIPEERSPVRPPSTADEKERFYDHWSYVAALDLFIIRACAQGVLVADDPEYRLFLTRQIGDDGYHAQRFREQIREVTGRDPLADIDRHARAQQELFGDIAARGLLGHLAFQVHYEIHVVPSMLINGRTSTVNDPRLVELAAERFLPDEAYHRSYVANWWRRHLHALPPDERAEQAAGLAALEAEGWARRHDDLRWFWAQARAATGSRNEGIEALTDRWRGEVLAVLGLT